MNLEVLMCLDNILNMPETADLKVPDSTSYVPKSFETAFRKL